jgi:Fe-coproporphyrin III synthase
MASRFWHYAPIAFRFCVLRQDVPLVLVMVVGERCNLACRHCRVANTGRPDMTFTQGCETLARLRQDGLRELHIEGGEPFLWRDGEHDLDSLIAEARSLGYFGVQVYTNGTFPLRSAADVLWVGLDGVERDHNALRGDYFAQVVANIKAAAHPRVALVCTINSLNRPRLREFLEFVRDERLPVLGVMFYFHTPYYGRDDLFLPAPERNQVIGELLAMKRQRLPILNSAAALRAVRDGTWERPMRYVRLVDVDGDYVCCRANSPAVCEDCGYMVCAEMTEARRLRPSAILGLWKYR